MKSLLLIIVVVMLSQQLSEQRKGDIKVLSITGGPCKSGIECTTRTCQNGVCIRGVSMPPSKTKPKAQGQAKKRLLKQKKRKYH